MNQTNDTFYLIEGYLNGSLSEAEKGAFEQELATNVALQEQVEMSRLSQLALMRRKLYEVKSISEAIDKEEKRSAKTKRITLVTVGIALLVAGGAYVWFSNIQTAQEREPSILPTQTHTPEAQTMVLEKPELIFPATPEGQSNRTVTKQTAKTALIEQEIPLALPIVSSMEKDTIASVFKKETVLQNQEKTAPKVETKIPVDHCAQIVLDAYIGTESACLNEQNGRIFVSGFKGGQAPYRFKVLDESSQEVAASHLGQGLYSVVITDNDHCAKKITGIALSEVDCRKDFELNASHNEIVELETASESATFTVYDKGGNVYFYHQFGQGERIQWNGTSSNGDIQKGYFLFQISYQDGKMRKGSITVVR